MGKPQRPLDVKPVPAMDVLVQKGDPELIARINALLSSTEPRGRLGRWKFNVTDVTVEQRQVIQRLYRLAGWRVHGHISSRAVHLVFCI